MPDFLNKEERSRLMARIRSRDTRPERYVRRQVWAAGFRYRLHVRKLPGTPDLVLKRHRTVVLVQGCFWHNHDCPKGRRRPAANPEFWNAKLNRNAARDAENQAKLEALGWTVFPIWECTIKGDTEGLLNHLAESRRLHSTPSSSPATPEASKQSEQALSADSC